MKGSHNISLYCCKFFCDFKFIKGSILNSKCIEGRGRSRLGGKRLVGCGNEEENLFCSKGCNYGGTCLLIQGNFDSFDNQESLLSVFLFQEMDSQKKRK